MSNDAFPDAKQLFRDAFSLPDPVPAVLELIKAHPTSPAAMNLLEGYTVVVQENPSRAHALALALAAVCDPTVAPVLEFGRPLEEMVFVELADVHNYGFDSKDDRVVPTNTFLLASLLSGISIKYNLTDSSDQYYLIWRCLDNDNLLTWQVSVIGSCIQLLTSGSIIIQTSQSCPIGG